MLKARNRNTRRRREIFSKLKIKTPEQCHRPRSDVFAVNVTYFTRYSSVSIVAFEQVNAGQKPVLWICIYPQAERRHRIAVFIVNFKHISHFVLMFLLLILSMYFIDGFDILYFSRFQIKMNPSFIVYSFLEKISTKQNAHLLASLSKQNMFITNFKANCNANFLISVLSFVKQNKLILTCAINATCKNNS